jgi:hypothetical protein
MKSYCLILFLLMAGCTYSITMVHTQGEASDVVDEQQTPSTQISPNLSVPSSMLP